MKDNLLAKVAKENKVEQDRENFVNNLKGDIDRIEAEIARKAVRAKLFNANFKVFMTYFVAGVVIVFLFVAIGYRKVYKGYEFFYL